MPFAYDPTHYLYMPGVQHAATASYTVDQFIPFPPTEPHSGSYELVYCAEGLSYYDWLQQKRAEMRQRQLQQRQQWVRERKAAAQRMSASQKAFQAWSFSKQREQDIAAEHQRMIEQQREHQFAAHEAEHMAHKAAVLRAWLSQRSESLRLRREISQMSAEDAIGKSQHMAVIKAQRANQQYQQWKLQRDNKLTRKRHGDNKKQQQQKQQLEQEQQKKAARVQAWREQLAKKDAESLVARRATRAAAKQAKQQRQQQAEQQYQAWRQRAADALIRDAVSAKVSEWDRARAARAAKQRAYERKHVISAYTYHTQHSPIKTRQAPTDGTHGALNTNHGLC